jgi:hypothetical protein
MRRYGSLLFALLLAVSALAKDKSAMQAEARAVIQRGIAASDLRVLSEPFIIHAGLTDANLEGRVSYTYYQAGPKSRLETIFSDRMEVRVGDGQRLWRERRNLFPFDLAALARPVTNPGARLRVALLERILDLRSRDDKMRCVTTEEADRTKVEYCFGEADGTLRELRVSTPMVLPTNMHMERLQIPSRTTITTFTDYFDVKGKLVPRWITTKFQGRVVRRYETASVNSWSRDEALLQAPEGFEEWQQCDDFVGAAPVSFFNALDPKILDGLKRTTVQLVIAPGGSLEDGYVVAETRRGDGQSLLAAMKKVAFRSARCGEQAIRGDLVITLGR